MGSIYLTLLVQYLIPLILFMIAFVELVPDFPGYNMKWGRFRWAIVMLPFMPEVPLIVSFLFAPIIGGVKSFLHFSIIDHYYTSPLNDQIHMGIIMLFFQLISIIAMVIMSKQYSSFSAEIYGLQILGDCMIIMCAEIRLLQIAVGIICVAYASIRIRKNTSFIFTLKDARSPEGFPFIALVPIPFVIWLIAFNSPLSPTFYQVKNSISFYLNVIFVAVIYIAMAEFVVFFNRSFEKNLRLAEQLEIQEELAKELFEANDDIIITFSQILESKSGETGGHVKRAAGYTAAIARELGFDDKYIKELSLASMMHDVGKLFVSNELIEKKGALTDAEFEAIKRHVAYGFKLLENTNGPIMDKARIIAKEHHEKWDGTGYGEGLLEDEIHIEAQIVAIADVFDALISERSYKKAWPLDKAFDEIVSLRGKQFSPKCVDAFIRCYPEIVEISNTIT